MKKATKLLKSNEKLRSRWRCKLVTLSILLTSSVSASTSELVWEKAPLPLDLEVGEERMVHFPQPMSVGLPANLREYVRVQSIGDTVYLKALKPFPRQRVLMRTKTDGSMIVFDIEAGTRAVDTASVFVRSTESNASKSEASSKLNYATLTRFAAQYAYAPARLVVTPRGLTKTATPKSTEGLIRALPVSTEPYAFWKTTDGLHLSAVKIVNESANAVELHPTDLRGHWLTATFHHYRLLPKGSGGDTTVVYLISSSPFAQALDI